MADDNVVRPANTNSNKPRLPEVPNDLDDQRSLRFFLVAVRNHLRTAQEGAKAATTVINNGTATKPGLPDRSVQFNDANRFAGDKRLLYISLPDSGADPTLRSVAITNINVNVASGNENISSGVLCQYVPESNSIVFITRNNKFKRWSTESELVTGSAAIPGGSFDFGGTSRCSNIDGGRAVVILVGGAHQLQIWNLIALTSLAEYDSTAFPSLPSAFYDAVFNKAPNSLWSFQSSGAAANKYPLFRYDLTAKKRYGVRQLGSSFIVTTVAMAGSNMTCTYTTLVGTAPAVDQWADIRGMANDGNNAQGKITAVGAGTFTIVNALGVNASGQVGAGGMIQLATAGSPQLQDSPVGDKVVFYSNGIVGSIDKSNDVVLAAGAIASISGHIGVDAQGNTWYTDAGNNFGCKLFKLDANFNEIANYGYHNGVFDIRPGSSAGVLNIAPAGDGFAFLQTEDGTPYGFSAGDGYYDMSLFSVGDIEILENHATSFDANGNGLLNNNNGTSGVTTGAGCFWAFLNPLGTSATLKITKIGISTAAEDIMSLLVSSNGDLSGDYVQATTAGNLNISGNLNIGGDTVLRGNLTLNGVLTASIRWGTLIGTLSDQADLQTALDAKVDDSQLDVDSTMAANSDLKLATQKATKTALALKASLASPTFTGTPAGPTAVAGTNTTQLATTAFVTAAIAAVASVTSVTGEVVGGTINGINTAFTIVNVPTVGSVRLFQNGIRLQSGAGNDYTIAGANITMLTAPSPGDKLIADYTY